MNLRNRLIYLSAVLMMPGAPLASAAGYKVLPFQYVDVAGEYGAPVSPTVVSAKWANKQGITGNPADFGLVLVKDTATSTYASAGAVFKGMEGDAITAATVFGYSYKTEFWCGAGAPRFNVKVTDGVNKATYAVGCANPSTTTETVDAAWTRKTWAPDKFFLLGENPGNVPLVGSTIVSVVIVYDEGTDVGPGKAVLDDIQYNEAVIGNPSTSR